MTDVQAVMMDRPLGGLTRESGGEMPSGLDPQRELPSGVDRPPWLSMHETSVYLDVAYSSLAGNWRKWGLTSYKVGRERKFRRDEVDDWLKAKATA